MTLSRLLLLSFAMFSIGVFGVLARRHVIALLLSIELMFNGANLAILSVAWAHGWASGIVLVLFGMAVSDYREALHASLLLPPENMPELIREIEAMGERTKEPSRYPKQPCLALDTNLAYKRLLSRLSLSGDNCGAKDFDPSRVQVLVANLVEREVSERVRRKYTPQEIAILRRAFASPQLLEDMTNCLHKDGRRAMNALAELTSIRSRYSVWDVQGGEWSPDKEARDAEILNALAQHAREENIDILYL